MSLPATKWLTMNVEAVGSLGIHITNKCGIVPIGLLFNFAQLVRFATGNHQGLRTTLYLSALINSRSLRSSESARTDRPGGQVRV